MTREERADVVQRVRELYPETPFPSPYLTPLWVGRSELINVPGHFAVVQAIKDDKGEDNVHVFAPCVTSEYNLVFHEEVVDAGLRLCAEFRGTYGEADISIGFLNEGAQMCLRALFPKSLHKIKGSEIRPEIRVWNSYDTLRKFTVEFGALQMVCTNGLVAYRTNTRARKRHVQSLFIQEEFGTLEEGMASLNEQCGIWEDWAKKSITAHQTEVLIERLPFRGGAFGRNSRPTHDGYGRNAGAVDG